METYKKHLALTVFFNYAKCIIAFGRYADGSHQMVLREKSSGRNVAMCTVNMAQDRIRISALNSSVLIKSWGVNEGLYEVLRDNNIIGKSRSTKNVGWNKAYECELLINPDEYDKI